MCFALGGPKGRQFLSQAHRLPSHPEIGAKFGVSTAINQKGKPIIDYTVARISVYMTFSMNLGLDAEMAPQSTGEHEMAIKQLQYVGNDDVLLWNRDYAEFLMMAQVTAYGAHFIGRCSDRSFLQLRNSSG